MRWTAAPPTAHPRRVQEGSRRGSVAHFFAHLFSAACHIPPAFSQSAFVVYFDISPDGLAAGDELEELPDVLEPAPLPDVLPELLLPDVPDGLPELPDVLPPLPVDCAAAITGAKATTATRRTRTSFSIYDLLWFKLRCADPGEGSNVRAAGRKAVPERN